MTRDEDNGSELKEIGARIAVADIRDADALRDVFRSGRRAFLLNPPADPSGDTDAEERANVSAIVEALDGSGLEKVVAASTYGARPGERCGDLTVLHEFEEKLRAQSIPAAINRGAYYMSNWAGMLEAVRETGILPSFFPADFALPMVAPEDLGEAAAERLLSPVDDIELRHVEGPSAYTPSDVAKAIGDAYGLSVDLEIVPSEALQSTFLQFGFSEEAAASYRSGHQRRASVVEMQNVFATRRVGPGFFYVQHENVLPTANRKCGKPINFLLEVLQPLLAETHNDRIRHACSVITSQKCGV